MQARIRHETVRATLELLHLADAAAATGPPTAATEVVEMPGPPDPEATPPSE
jgi:hypothetical protein